MEWRHLGFDWNHVKALLATAEEGSLSAAGRALGAAQPTLGRQVTALEQELGVELFVRQGRGLRLTPTGLELVEHARGMAEHALRLSRVAAGRTLALDGPVVISAGEVIAAHMLPPIVAGIRARHPGIQIQIVATNQVSDLGGREADIAIRNFRPTDGDLVARKVGEDRGYLYATPAYLESLGRPCTVEALSAAQAEYVAFDETDVFMKGLRATGLEVTPDNFPWVSANQHVQWALITQGSGIGVMMARVGDADPRVVRVVPEQISFPVPLWLTSHAEVRTSHRVRTVFDLLASALASPDAPPCAA